MINAAALTAQRTGAVGALGVKYMTPPAASSLGTIGCGMQGAWQAIFACSLRRIREIFCNDRSAVSIEKFSETVQRHAPSVRITPCVDTRELLNRTSLIIAATTSTNPVLPNHPALLEGKHFISVGSFKPSMQELPDAVYRLAGSLALDAEHARHEVGDVINALRNGHLKETDIYSIAECIAGRRTIDTSETTVYKTVGMAAYDLFAAQAFYEAAKLQGIGQEISV